MNLKSSALLVLMTLVAATPRGAEAASDKFWWGVGGLAIGSVAGYAVGRETASWDRHTVHAQPAYYQPGPTYYYQDGLPVMTGQSYYKETRVWPFYRRVENYPIASMSARLGRPQAVSMVDEPRWVEVGSQAGDQKPVNVEIGDNASNVNVTIGGKAAEPAQEATELVPVVNNTDPAGKRVVNTPMTASKAREYRDQQAQREGAQSRTVQQAPKNSALPATSSVPKAGTDETKSE